VSTTNPTQLHLGSSGFLNARDYRVVGRVVMSAEDSGETYYWNEFQIDDPAGQHAILVYEETERGGEWRFFTRFDPPRPMSIEQAGGQSVGDTVNLDGTEMYVTFVGVSRVRGIEGWAPKTEFVGKEEKYFNADLGTRMIVASYTPREIEFYTGETLLSGVVEGAFKIPKPPRSAYALARYGRSGSQNYWPAVAMIAVLVLVLGLPAFSSCNAVTSRAPSMRVFSARRLPSAEGEAVMLGGTKYYIVAHNVVQILEQGLQFDRHEFTLADPDGKKFLLIGGLQPEEKDWCLLSEAIPETPLKPFGAGNLPAGRTLRADGTTFTVTELFQCKSGPLGQPLTQPGDRSETHYGFLAKSGANVLMARWNETNITWQTGQVLSPSTAQEFTRQLK
jgi:hypothetical protein